MDFELPEEARMIRELVEKFVEDELMPLEASVLARDSQGQPVALTAEENAHLHARCKELGLFGLDVPEQYGGSDIGLLAKLSAVEALARTVVPFTFPPDSPNLHMLIATANEEQKEKYLDPYARGESVSAIAISEPQAGGDPAGMRTRAIKDGNHWVINGRKIWISRIKNADFTIVMAVTDIEKGSRGGITAFLVDKDTPGMIIEREIAMLGGRRTYEVVFEDCRLDAGQVLGEIGNGFGPMQLRLNTRRLEMGATSLGMAQRALDMMLSHVKQRTTFGELLADRQAIQWWIADAATRMHALRLMVWDAAYKVENGQDARTEASMIKYYATEMLSDVIDNAMQSFGAMGVTKELPLQLMWQNARTMRVYEGPTEVHKWVIARRQLRDAKD
ncbi:MAG: acyl-CoA/acyl-ACP dehydrogenase [Gammaproteobacteria bacterium]|nr:acyl-CoA/acyl-ACP dehydrogenase [Gammaproteobacteria bacterium]